MRHLCVHFRCILIRMFNMMIFSLMVILVLSITISCSVTESLSGGVSPLQSIRSLGPVSGVSKGLPLLNPLVNHHITLRLALILIEVLLLLIKCLTGWSSPILMIAVTLMILVLRCDHLCPSLLALLLRPESRIKGLFFIINWVKRIQYTRVSIALYLNIVTFILNNCQICSAYLRLQTT